MNIATQAPDRERIPSIRDLLNEAPAGAYTASVVEGSHITYYIRLSPNDACVPLLAKHALVHLVGLNSFNDSIPVSILLNIADVDLGASIQSIVDRGPENCNGWIGEMISDFLIRHILGCEMRSLSYSWYLLEPPKGDVNDHGLDFVVAYELSDQNATLGHASGEIKTYGNLSNGKAQAYSKLVESYERARDDEIRRTLNALFRHKGGVNPVVAAIAAMRGERSFMPCVLHDRTTEFLSRETYHDLAAKFPSCIRENQRIGIQVSIDQYDDFFDEFVDQMRSVASNWNPPIGQIQDVGAADV